MPDWTLERILRQAQKGGVNRPQAEWLVAEVRRLRDGIVRHREELRNRGVDGRGTPAQAPNERLWALVDHEESADG